MFSSAVSASSAVTLEISMNIFFCASWLSVMNFLPVFLLMIVSTVPRATSSKFREIVSSAPFNPEGRIMPDAARATIKKEKNTLLIAPPILFSELQSESPGFPSECNTRLCYLSHGYSANRISLLQHLPVDYGLWLFRIPDDSIQCDGRRFFYRNLLLNGKQGVSEEKRILLRVEGSGFRRQFLRNGPGQPVSLIRKAEYVYLSGLCHTFRRNGCGRVDHGEYFHGNFKIRILPAAFYPHFFHGKKYRTVFEHKKKMSKPFEIGRKIYVPGPLLVFAVFFGPVDRHYFPYLYLGSL